MTKLKEATVITETEKEAATEKATEFTKAQLLSSNWYSHRRDAINVLLEDDKTYSHAAVEKLISDFMKGKVK